MRASKITGIYGFTNAAGVTIWSSIEDDDVKALQLGDASYTIETEMGKQLQQPRVLSAVEVYGDLNGDGKVNALDIDTFNMFAALYQDLNGDGAINALDVTSLEKLIYLQNYKDITPSKIGDLSDKADVNQDFAITTKDATDLYDAIVSQHDLDKQKYVVLDMNRYALDKTGEVYSLQVIETDAEGNMSRGVDVYPVTYYKQTGTYTTEIEGQPYQFGESAVYYTTDYFDLEIMKDIYADIGLGKILQPYVLERADINRSGFVTDRDYLDLQDAFNRLDTWADHLGVPMPITAYAMEASLKRLVTDRMNIIQRAESLREEYEITPAKMLLVDLDGDGDVDTADRGIFTYARDKYPFMRVYADLNNNGILDYEDINLIADAVTEAWAVATPQPEYMRYVDINSDGVFNLLDIETLTKALKYHASVDGDSDLDAADIAKIGEVMTYIGLAVTQQREIMFTRRSGVRSERYAGQKVRFNGLELFADITDEGRFVFFDAAGNVYRAYLGLDFVEIEGIIADVYLDEDGRIVAQEKHEPAQPFLISEHLADEVVRMDGKLYDVVRDYDNETVKVLRDGTEITTLEDLGYSPTRTVEIDGEDYIIYTDRGEIDGGLFIMRAGDASLKISDQMIKLEGRTYKVMHNPDGTFTFESDFEKRTSFKGDNRVVLGGTVYEIREDLFSGRVTLVETYKTSAELCGQVIEVEGVTFRAEANL
ncbi:MAG: dockerin type I domain-containing protein, partial [Candidatus Omnitrophota bacterium]